MERGGISVQREPVGGGCGCYEGKQGSLPIRPKHQTLDDTVRSRLLYAAEVHIWTKTDLRKIERWQTKVVRHIAKAQSHILRERSDELRARLHAMTGRVQKWLSDESGNIAVRGMMIGRLSFKGERPRNTPGV